MILLNWAKSLLKSLKARSRSVAEKDRGAENVAQRENHLVPGKKDARDGTSFPQAVDASNSGKPQGSPSLDILVPDFQLETSAQDYFNDSRGEQARGDFHKVEGIRWDHDEAGWNIEELEFEVPASPAARHHSKPPTDGGHNEAADAVDRSRTNQDSLRRLEALAVRRRWLVAAAALDKLSQSAQLSKRERAAIERVLNNATTLSQHRSDAEALRGLLRTGQNQVEEVDCRAPIAQFNARSAKIPAKVGNPPARVTRLPSEAVSPTREEICSSVDRVRSVASGRGWLSPKSHGALEKILSNQINLSISESNSLNYLMGRMRETSEIEDDLRILRKIIRT